MFGRGKLIIIESMPCLWRREEAGLQGALLSDTTFEFPITKTIRNVESKLAQVPEQVDISIGELLRAAGPL